MDTFWSIVSDPDNRATLGWIGLGLASVASGAWAVVKYFFPRPAKDADKAKEAPSPAEPGARAKGGPSPVEPGASGELSRFRLVVQGKRGDVQRYDLLNGRTLMVGRGSEADIRLPNYDKAASRRNAMITVHRDHLEVANIEESVNGTMLNGAFVERAGATPGDVITCGATRLIVELQPQGTRPLGSQRSLR